MGGKAGRHLLLLQDHGSRILSVNWGHGGASGSVVRLQLLEQGVWTHIRFKFRGLKRKSQCHGMLAEVRPRVFDACCLAFHQD